jgi:hypothetical protein
LVHQFIMPVAAAGVVLQTILWGTPAVVVAAKAVVVLETDLDEELEILVRQILGAVVGAPEFLLPLRPLQVALGRQAL